MIKEIGNMWNKALRSGEYKQTDGALCDSRGFCCLGVLTDLYIKEHNLEWERCGNSRRFDGNSSILTNLVMKWAKISSSEGWLKSNRKNLAEMNDSGSTFLEIADIIEANMEEL